jgi:hypothetical protein
VQLAVAAPDAVEFQIVGCAFGGLALFLVIGALVSDGRNAEQMATASGVLAAIAAVLGSFPLYAEHFVVIVPMVTFIAWAWLFLIWLRRSARDASGTVRPKAVEKHGKPKGKSAAGEKHQGGHQPGGSGLGGKRHRRNLGRGGARMIIFAFILGVAMGFWRAAFRSVGSGCTDHPGQ